MPGTPLLTASGYVVARRKAVVSAKTQGRLADFRVDEGPRVQLMLQPHYRVDPLT
jgi:hypothetical protein